jgi:hypothetical protein
MYTAKLFENRKAGLEKNNLWNQRDCPKIHLPLLGMVRTQDPACTTLWDTFYPGSNTEESCR